MTVGAGRKVTTRFVDGGDLDPEQLLGLYSSVGWGAHTKDPDRLARAMKGASLIAVAHSAGDLIGLARVISDGATICYLQDVLVHPDYQRTGVGRELVVKLLERYADVRQKVLLTDDDPGQKAFYESLGFTGVAEAHDGSLRAFVRFDSPADRLE